MICTGLTGLLAFFVAVVIFWALIQVKYVRLILIWGLALAFGCLTYYVVQDAVDNFMGIAAGLLAGALIYYKHTNDYKLYRYYQHLREQITEQEEKAAKTQKLGRVFQYKQRKQGGFFNQNKLNKHYKCRG